MRDPKGSQAPYVSKANTYYEGRHVNLVAAIYKSNIGSVHYFLIVYVPLLDLSNLQNSYEKGLDAGIKIRV